VKTITNKIVRKLISKDIFNASLNITYENSMTRNFLIWENNKKILIRVTPQKIFTTLAIAFFCKYNHDYLQYVDSIVKKVYNTHNIITMQFYSEDLLIEEFKSIGFKVDLVLRDHVRIEDEYYTIVSLSKGGENTC